MIQLYCSCTDPIVIDFIISHGCTRYFYWTLTLVHFNTRNITLFRGIVSPLHWAFYITLIILQHYNYSNNCKVITQFQISFSLLTRRYRRGKCSSHDVANRSTSFKPRLNTRTEGRSVIIAPVYMNPRPQRIDNNCHLYLISCVLAISSRYLISRNRKIRNLIYVFESWNKVIVKLKSTFVINHLKIV